MSELLEKLNAQQREAALHKDGPLLILAGAGSGKTATMTHRIAHLIKEEGVDPYNILAVTFTNKAAAEMRERTESLVGGGINMWILTFHAMCLRILRKFSDRLGYSGSFAVYDPSDQKTVVKNILKEIGNTDKQLTPQYILSIISKCKEKMLTPDEYLNQSSEYNISIAKKVRDIFVKYENVLHRNNAMDFDDLLINTVRLFRENPDALEYYQNRFRYIMVDEYQDTNYVQYLIVSMIAKAHNNICVVGDDDQCIYQWRGADIRNILDFEKDFKNTKTIKLEENYRSTKTILKAAHSVISNNRGRKDKELWTAGEEGEKIDYFRADNEKDEARHIAHYIDMMHMKGADYKDFAVLYRVNAQSRVLEEALGANHIPYRLLGGMRYYDRKEIKDLISYMSLVQNPRNDVALNRIINEPKRGIGAKTLGKIQALAELKNQSIFETIADPEVQAALATKAGAAIADLTDVIRKYSAEQENLRVSDIYEGILNETRYVQALMDQNTVEADGRIDNLMEFKSVIYDFENKDPDIGLGEFLEKLALMSDIDNHDAEEDAVVLMTLHSAKGLEFPVVFMPGMEDGLFPGYRAMDSPNGIEEERRLCYVGITRAKKKLILSSAECRMMYGNTNYTIESQFLSEIDRSCMTGEAVREKKKNKAPGDGIKRRNAFNPFEEMKKAQIKQIKKKPPEGALVLAAGDTVKHAKFGKGLVIETDSKTVSVMFDSVGVKKLLLEVAPIEKL